MKLRCKKQSQFLSLLLLLSHSLACLTSLFTLSNLAFAFLVYTASCDNWNRGINHASSVHRWTEASHLVPKVHSWFRSSKEELKKARSQDRAKEALEPALSSPLYWKGFFVINNALYYIIKMYQTKQSNTVCCIGIDNKFRLPHFMKIFNLYNPQFIWLCW